MDEHCVPVRLEELQSYSLFSKRFVWKKNLGSGSDGIVASYTDMHTKGRIAVKMPREENTSRINALKEEISILHSIGKHDHIVSMLTFCHDFWPIGPAIFFPVCDLGDLLSYWKHTQGEKVRANVPARFPEVTILKLLADMISALDYLHNSHPVSFVHGDLKPENILVCTPPGYTGVHVSHEPIFKITDLGRITIYPTHPGSLPVPDAWRGTYEYAPPLAERHGPLKPAIDMYSLGATIAFVALGFTPNTSRARITALAARAGVRAPPLTDDDAWHEPFWRAQRLVVYRPICATKKELCDKWDVDGRHGAVLGAHAPYSQLLNLWYKMLMHEDAETRVSAKHMMKYIKPLVEMRIGVERVLAKAVDGWNRGSSTRMGRRME
ncbi:hypothetical protein ACEQ8H_006050 [Pleosporales sp. CAS-2024a]